MGTGKGKNKRTNLTKRNTIPALADNPMLFKRSKKKSIVGNISGNSNIHELSKEFWVDVDKTIIKMQTEMNLMSSKDWQLNNNQVMFLYNILNSSKYKYHDLVLGLEDETGLRLEQAILTRSDKIGKPNMQDRAIGKVLEATRLTNQHREHNRQQAFFDKTVCMDLERAKNKEAKDKRATEKKIKVVAEDINKLKDEDLHF